MTGRPEWTDEDEALAAEHALGVLTGAEAAAAERRVATDAAFRAAVAGWQERLSDLAADAPAVPPPDRVRRAVEKRLFDGPTLQRAGEASWPWAALDRLRGAVFGALAASVALAVLLVALSTYIGPPAAPGLGATLAADTGALRFEATWVPAEAGFRVVRAAGEAPAPGQAHELWIIAPGAAPVSLGLIDEGGLAVAYPEPPAGWTLAVSLEPAGGSPTGAPTGPVLATGVLTQL